MADDDDLKPLLKSLLSTVEGIARDMVEMKTEIVSIKGELRTMDVRLDGFEKRLDDQGRILAALVPRITE
ncbi:hypothetical protein [Azospirillum rugosum]|uniref:Uncharacterized protein n=1 Tax=Azospirillum rugosum TaxID=416170 RepID=A0ABS4SF10_9PROT|nr:hypothetical protein [Azospirillum rugosum]MBP2291163.1 hypothetical protein [Azospirillum rugosum]MDQ0524773.1 hypothetical protein [Azospirillum rugosum]